MLTSDATQQGLLTISQTVAVTADGNTYTINGVYNLNGNIVPLRLRCYSFSESSTPTTIGNLRAYLQSQGGTLTVPAPIPFGQ